MDLKGAKDRLGFDARRAAMEIEDEFDENRWESQEALKYGGSTHLDSVLLHGLTLLQLAFTRNSHSSPILPSWSF